MAAVWIGRGEVGHELNRWMSLRGQYCQNFCQKLKEAEGWYVFDRVQ